MSATVNFIANMNNNEDANKVAVIMKEVASMRTPEYPKEIIKFMDGIVVDGNTVKIEDNYSLMSATFCELISQIMKEIARHSFGAITMDAWYTSYNCGYEADFCGRVFKNGKFRMSFSQRGE